VVVPLKGLPDVLYGQTEARRFTPPLVDVMDPANSYGHAVIRFARYVLKTPLEPWQEWLVIRAGELLPDGRPRFRQVLVLVARQNGKTFLMEVLAMYWLLVEMQKLILGMSSNLQLAKDTMLSSVERVEFVEQLARNLKTPKVGNNDVSVSTRGLMVGGRPKTCSYKTAAATRKAARGKRVDRLMVDELREQLDMEAYGAGMYTMQARPHGQAWFFSNQGDDRSVVLNMLHTMGVAYIENPNADDVDERLGLFEWSAPDGMDVMDKRGWQMANPNLGRHNDESAIASEAKKARRLGGETEAKFRTEVLCQRVKHMNGAFDPVTWNDAGNAEAVLPRQSHIALGIDISIDMQHATLIAAEKLPDGCIRVEPIKEWYGKHTTHLIRQQLPEWVQKVKPRVVSWMPAGPMATLSAELQNKKWLGRVEAHEIRGDMADACMSIADLVAQGEILHNDDPMLTQQVLGTGKVARGDRFVFQRVGDGYCDASYAMAAAVQALRTLPPPMKAQIIPINIPGR
jgi:phage terminase large subunit-like protein